jgi:hypothetical protein
MLAGVKAKGRYGVDRARADIGAVEGAQPRLIIILIVRRQVQPDRMTTSKRRALGGAQAPAKYSALAELGGSSVP